MLRQIIKFINKNRVFLSIVLLAAILRYVAISSNPPSLNWDEASHGYNAYSILKTGKDEWGKSFPIIFKAYGDYKLPVYIYAVATSEAIFGLNTFAVRLPSVLAGVSTVVFTYLLVLELGRLGRRLGEPQGSERGLSKSKKYGQFLALLAAFLVAVEPWSLFLSRGAFEANLALAFIVVGVYSFIKSLYAPYYMLLSTFLLGLSVWTYNSARVFVPLFLVGLIVIFRRELVKIFREQKFLILNSLFIILLFFLPMFWQLLNPAGQARYGKVAIIDEGTVGQIIQARNDSSLNPTITRLIHNRPTYFISQFTKNYLSHFSLEFLFFEGGSHYQFSVPAKGLLYPINLVFILVGFFVLFKKRDKVGKLLLMWLFLAPIPSSLVREAPHVLRSITFLPIPMILTAYGVKVVFSRLRDNMKLYVSMIYIIIVGLFCVNYLSNYFGDYRKNYSWSWQYGYKQVVDYARENYEKYDKIIVTKKYGEPHEFFLFHWPWDPARFQNDPNLIRFYQSNWYWVDRFDKFYFVNDWDIPREEWENFVLESGEEFNCENQKCLLITSPGNYPKGWIALETISFLDGEPAFEILANIK